MDNKEYVYVFTRQDISPEQQLVQSAHATLVLGNKLKHKSVDELYFAVIGVPNLLELGHVMQNLNRHKHEFVTFYEPDLGGTLTAVATFPIPDEKRGKLLEYKKLRFSTA